MERSGTRLTVDGKFFSRGGERVFLNGVTFGPFPEPVPDPVVELRRVRDAGFNMVRIYERPSVRFLDACVEYGLMVFVGLSWEWTRVFLGGGNRTWFEEGRLMVREELAVWGGHEAVVGYFVANEVSPDLARWMGARAVRLALEELIDEVREVAPWLVVGYSNFPSSEYLEPGNADFTGFNVYLEDRERFAGYLPRLHHLAGDRPVLLTEFGMDTRRNGEGRQAEVLGWYGVESLEAGVAGRTVFAWSDAWRNGVRVEEDWDFGLVRRDGSEKEALGVVGDVGVGDFAKPRFSVIVCVYNGAGRIGACLESLRDLDYPDYEVIVVDDGSTDGTVEVVKGFDFVRLLEVAHGGLSAARNAGAGVATGEIFAYTDDDCEVDQGWLLWLARGYAEHGWDACGGPNIPPRPLDEDEAVVASAPGAPSHVMLSDSEAEHVPGCNLSVRRDVFEALGGFSVRYWVAGDDVDFCWRLEEDGYRIGFEGAAFVWHRRRTTLFRYFRQQWFYGKAEALLAEDHPRRFGGGVGARWKGRVYTGEAMGAREGSVIYYGVAGEAGYQQVETTMMPRRRLAEGFGGWRARLKLGLAEWLQPRLRRWARCWYGGRRLEIFRVRIGHGAQVEDVGAGLRVGEFFYEVDGVEARGELLERLRGNGWVEEDAHSVWDLGCGDSRVLLAMLKVGPDAWKLGVRVLGRGGEFGEGYFGELVDLKVGS